MSILSRGWKGPIESRVTRPFVSHAAPTGAMQRHFRRPPVPTDEGPTQCAPSPCLTSWTHPSYELRVRGHAYLWGSAGIQTNLKFDRALRLHLRNDQFGEPVTLATRVAGEALTTIGTLEAGECVTLPVQDIAGVRATCATETTVHCLIN